MKIISGIQPSGKLHLGNYFGAIQQFLELQNSGHECLFFIADLHAQTSVHDADKLAAYTQEIAMDYLALGLDPTNSKVSLFRQSDIPEVSELFWYLLTITPMGLLERAHSYKDKVAKGLSPNLGLFTYPVLMAADILIYGSDEVPVGRDQQQHLEMTRDIASKFNTTYGEDLLKLPRARIQETTATIPGLDGQKMSKSYDNTLDLFEDEAVLRKRIMSLKTDSLSIESPKDINTPLYMLLKLLASPSEMAEIDRTYREGGKGYGHYKQQLADMFLTKFGPARAKRNQLASAYVDEVFAMGAKQAREHVLPIMEKVRKAVGIRALSQ